MDRSKAKMINYGIVYGLSDYGLADRLNIPREEAKAFIDAYLERFPTVARVHRRDDRAGHGAGPRHDAVRPPPPDPRAPGAQLAGAHARRAPGRQHRHPGHGGRRHEARDDRAATRAARRGLRDAADPHDPRRAAVRGPAGGDRARSRELVEREMVAPWATASRRWRSTSGVGADLAGGEVVDRRRAVVLTAVAGGADRAAGADQLAPRQGGRDLPGRVRVVRDRDGRAARRSRSLSKGGLGAGRRRPRTCPGTVPDRRPARRGLRRPRVLVTVRTLGAGGVTAATIAGQLTMSRRRRPVRAARRRAAAGHRAAPGRHRAAGRRRRARRAATEAPARRAAQVLASVHVPVDERVVGGERARSQTDQARRTREDDAGAHHACRRVVVGRRWRSAAHALQPGRSQAPGGHSALRSPGRQSASSRCRTRTSTPMVRGIPAMMSSVGLELRPRTWRRAAIRPTASPTGTAVHSATLVAEHEHEHRQRRRPADRARARTACGPGSWPAAAAVEHLAAGGRRRTRERRAASAWPRATAAAPRESATSVSGQPTRSSANTAVVPTTELCALEMRPEQRPRPRTEAGGDPEQHERPERRRAAVGSGRPDPVDGSGEGTSCELSGDIGHRLRGGRSRRACCLPGRRAFAQAA